MCIDDYYGRHEYGYGFKRDGSDATWDDCFNDCEFYPASSLVDNLTK